MKKLVFLLLTAILLVGVTSALTIIDENGITTNNVHSDIVGAKGAFKDFNATMWQTRLNFAQELALTILQSNQDYALKLISTTRNISITTSGEDLNLKKRRLINSAELAKQLINTNLIIAQARIFEARNLVKLNGENSSQAIQIEAEAVSKSNQLANVALNQSIIIDNALLASINEIENNDDGIRYCLNNGTNCKNSSVLVNITAGDYYSSDGSRGITNTLDFKACRTLLANVCNSWCTFRIKNGLITGCI